MSGKGENQSDAKVTHEQHEPGATPNGDRKNGLAGLGIGALMLAAGVFLWLNPEMLRVLVASQRPSGATVPFFTAAGTLLWLLAPYALMIGGFVVAVRGAWRAIPGGSPDA